MLEALLRPACQNAPDPCQSPPQGYQPIAGGRASRTLSGRVRKLLSPAGIPAAWVVRFLREAHGDPFQPDPRQVLREVPAARGQSSLPEFLHSVREPYGPAARHFQ